VWYSAIAFAFYRFYFSFFLLSGVGAGVIMVRRFDFAGLIFVQ
jgi:hypothetical protein